MIESARFEEETTQHQSVFYSSLASSILPQSGTQQESSSPSVVLLDMHIALSAWRTRPGHCCMEGVEDPDRHSVSVMARSASTIDQWLVYELRSRLRNIKSIKPSCVLDIPKPLERMADVSSCYIASIYQFTQNTGIAPHIERG